MDKETQEAIARLREAMAGKPSTPTIIKGVRHFPLAKVCAADVLLACNAAVVKPDDSIVPALRMGSEAGRPDREVAVQTNHLGHLLERCAGAPE